MDAEQPHLKCLGRSLKAVASHELALAWFADVFLIGQGKRWVAHLEEAIESSLCIGQLNKDILEVKANAIREVQRPIMMVDVCAQKQIDVPNLRRVGDRSTVPKAGQNLCSKAHDALNKSGSGI